MKGRESGGNQVGIDKVRALGFGGKEGAGEGGFAGTVRSGEDEDFLRHAGLGKFKKRRFARRYGLESVYNSAN